MSLVSLLWEANIAIYRRHGRGLKIRQISQSKSRYLCLGQPLTPLDHPSQPRKPTRFGHASRERSFFFLRDLFGRATLRAAEHGSDRYLAVSIRAACELCTDADCRSRFSLAATNKLLQARKCACSTAAISGGCSRNCLAP